MDSLKVWILWSTALHGLLVVVILAAQLLDFRKPQAIPLQVVLVYEPQPEPEPEDPPTPKPEPTAPVLGPTKRPTPKPQNTPTPTPKRTPSPTPTRNLNELKKALSEITQERQQTPTPRPSPAATRVPAVPATTAAPVANAGAESGASTGVTFSTGVTDSFKFRLIAELAAAMSREAPAVTKKYTTGVRFVLKPDGKVKSVNVTKKSGSTAVDQACERAVWGAAFPPPTGESAGRELTVDVNLSVDPN